MQKSLSEIMTLILGLQGQHPQVGAILRARGLVTLSTPTDLPEDGNSLKESEDGQPSSGGLLA